MLEAGALALEKVVEVGEGGSVVIFGGASLGPWGRGAVRFAGDMMLIHVRGVVKADISTGKAVAFAAAEKVNFGVAVEAG